MNKFLFTLAFGLAILANLNSQKVNNDNFVISHGPYLQNMSKDGVTIIWTTNKPAVPGVLLTDFNGKKRFIRNSHDGIIDGGATLHKVKIEGLEPGNTYSYKISSVPVLNYQAYKIYYGDTLPGKSETFSTPSLIKGKVSFYVMNDVHGLSGKMASYLKNGDINEQDLVFFNGDMIDFLQNSDQLFAAFIDTASKYFAANKQFIYVRGNHETRGSSARELKSYFEYKDESFYYSFDRGPVHFIVLDCGEDKPDDNLYYYGLADYDSYRLKELEWLKEEVKSEAFRKAKYRIVLVHMPIIKDEMACYGVKFLAEHFGPVLRNAGIDLMISAHTHLNAYGQSGFGYPVLINSNNSVAEVVADKYFIKATIKDTKGKIINTYTIK
jgi:acid phosphatase type 7